VKEKIENLLIHYIIAILSSIDSFLADSVTSVIINSSRLWYRYRTIIVLAAHACGPSAIREKCNDIQLNWGMCWLIGKINSLGRSGGADARSKSQLVYY